MVLQPLLFALRGIPQVKYEKILGNDNACFFTFFHNIGPNLAQILPQTTPTSIFFLLVSNEICYGMQLILKTLIGI